MASIKNISLKGIKKIVGMEGYGFYANLYADGKKIGSCADYGDGGCINITFDDKSFSELLATRREAYFTENPPEPIRLKKASGETITIDSSATDEDFIENLFELSMFEKDFKKALKNGYKVLAVINQGLSLHWLPSLEYAAKHEDELHMKKNDKVVYYSSLNDFIL